MMSGNVLDIALTLCTLLGGIAVIASAYNVFFSKHSGWKNILGAVIAVLIIHLCFSYSFVQELDNLSTHDGGAKLGFANYMAIYPHIVFYPLFLGYFLFLSLWMASEVVWRKSKILVINSAVLAVVIGLVATYLEGRGNYMMFFEFRQDHAFRSELSAENREVFSSVQKFLENHGTAPKFDGEMQKKADVLFSFDQTWGNEKDWASPAKKSYIVIYFYIVAMLIYFVLLAMAALRLSWDEKMQKDKKTYHFFMVVTYGLFLLWIPFRIYYNLRTKGPLFGDDTIDSIWGVKTPSFLWGITSSEFIPILLAFLYLLVCWIQGISKRGASTIERVRTLLSVVGVLFFTCCVLALVFPTLFSTTFGIHSQPKYILGRVVVLIILLWFGWCYVVDEKENTKSVKDKT